VSFCTLAGLDVEKATISLPKVGAWTADLVVANDTVPGAGSSVQLVWGAGGAVSLHGTVHRGGAPWGAGLVRVIGGADGMATPLQPSGYRATTVRQVLGDITNGAGETLSGSSDGQTLSTSLPFWARMSGQASECLEDVLTPFPVSWRFLADGSLWIGPETWPANNTSWSLMQDLPQYGRQVLTADIPDAMPGQSIAGRNLSYVRHEFDSETIRTLVIFEDS
jgi:hypothetical protein